MRIELSLAQDFLDILSVVGGIFYGNLTQRTITAICTDSRECREGDIFFAIKGNKHDGNNYIQEAISLGAIPIGSNIKTFGIKVDSGNKALLAFAKYYKTHLPYLKHTFAITGSVGKTTTKEFLKILSSVRYKTHATRGNYNNEIGVSFTILSAPKDTEILICELGMNHKGEIKTLSNAVNPNTAIITKIGSAHIGNLGNREDLINAKMEIVNGLSGILVVPHAESSLLYRYPKTKTHSSKTKIANTAVIKNSFEKFEMYRCGELMTIFEFPIQGNHIYECLSAAVSGAMEIKLSIEEILCGIGQINNNDTRHKIYSTSLGFDILDDSYNASLESVLADFSLLDEMKEYKSKSVLLGDILELGKHSEDIHKKIGRGVAEHDIKYVFLVGKLSSYIAKGAIAAGFDKDNIYINSDLRSPEITSSIICNKMKPGEILLVKASHEMNINRIIDLILGK